jgi:hypothetical protein
MNAFGAGNYDIIDDFNIIAKFGGREHNIQFNNNYTNFISIRKDDLCIINSKLHRPKRKMRNKNGLKKIK